MTSFFLIIPYTLDMSYFFGKQNFLLPEHGITKKKKRN